jgi:hypothetical protein
LLVAVAVDHTLVAVEELEECVFLFLILLQEVFLFLLKVIQLQSLLVEPMQLVQALQAVKVVTLLFHL